ncbi:unnamed protein product [Anisakis simplex]|uniref:G_PROTEIN_RECEP_F1_2 domain-containing protein n=1 Tax=Anisakis simplex TaxID=6269 RepID=A0A0M3KER9_ANISI|nr:unnamed protein product [Anisakis simplex]
MQRGGIEHLNPPKTSVITINNNKKSVAAWRNTVALARRKTRRKDLAPGGGPFTVLLIQILESNVIYRRIQILIQIAYLKKAFLMLTLNMIFWMPYCVMGILSTIMILDHSAYNFLNALVVLNAVSNLFL